MLDHVTLGVKDVSNAGTFYDDVLGTLGYQRLFEEDIYAIGYGVDRPIFWVVDPLDDDERSSGPVFAKGTHVAFKAKTRDQVEEFHRKALARGGKCCGKPGLRTYHDDYYAAYIYDPEGHKIEAVCGNAPYNVEKV